MAKSFPKAPKQPKEEAPGVPEGTDYQPPDLMPMRSADSFAPTPEDPIPQRKRMAGVC